jgi:hypothetical protein
MEEEQSIEEWVEGMKEYIAPRGRLNTTNLCTILAQVKERLDMQMKGVVLTAAIGDLLVEQGVIKKEDLDTRAEEIGDEMDQASAEDME